MPVLRQRSGAHPLSRNRALLHWGLPPLLALLLYWPGVTSWFQKDDFAWLGLYNMIHSWADFWNVLFHPYAQGTIRTLSERVFYTSFYALFGMHPLPYRLWAFATFAADLTLLSLVCTKITGSQAAGFWAAILWAINSNMAFALSWTAIYYELLCPLFFLLGLWLLMHDRLVAQWIVYLLGFGVLEQNVVYPAIAAACALCFNRRLLRPVLPMFLPAIAYTIWHMLAAPLSSSGPYRMHWDLSVFSTLWTYWKIALGPTQLILLHIYPSRGRSALAVILMLALIAFLICETLCRRWAALFFASWFVIVLAPLLPLRDHISEYYLTIPLAGLAMWGAWGLACYWRIAVIPLVIYVCVNIPLAHVNVVSFYDRSQQIHRMIAGVVDLHQGHPDAPIVLTHMDPDMFWSALYHRPFRLYGIDQIYIAPQDRAAIEATQPGQTTGADFSVPANALIYDVQAGRAVQ